MKKVIILGTSSLALETGQSIMDSDELELLGFIKERDEDSPGILSTYDLGTDINIISEPGPDVCIALDFHRIIPSEVIEKHTIINSHGGILPENRGYHTLGWGFINGYRTLGYTLHIMDNGLDSGPVIYTFRYQIKKSTTFQDVKTAIYEDQKANILKVVLKYLNKEIKAKPQNLRYPKYFSKRNLADCYIDWGMKSAYIENFIRALSAPAGPGAFTVYDNKKMTILSSELYPCRDYIEIPGHVVYKSGERILVKTGDKCLWIEDVIYDNMKMKAGVAVKKMGARLGINITEELLKAKQII
jgi:methionyl-tRNA formyltransferase